MITVHCKYIPKLQQIKIRLMRKQRFFLVLFSYFSVIYQSKQSEIEKQTLINFFVLKIFVINKLFCSLFLSYFHLEKKSELIIQIVR